MDRPTTSDRRILDRLNSELSLIPVPAAPEVSYGGRRGGAGGAAFFTIGLVVTIAAVGGVILLSQAPDRGASPNPAANGSNTLCPVTSTHDASGITVSSGDIGLVEIRPDSFPGEKVIVLVWRGASTGDALMLRAVALGPRGSGEVVWSVPATARPSPWGSVVFEANSKPIGNAGCWRLLRAGTPSTEPGIVIDLGL